MRITIIIPVFNVEPYIKTCLMSVIHQTYQGELECIVVDDCGTDKSMEVIDNIVSNYAGKIKIEIFHHAHNRGLSAARNTGLQEATGDYVFFLDSDDYLSEDCIKRLTEPLEFNSYDVVLGDLIKVKNGVEIATSMISLKLKDQTVLYDDDIIKTYRKKWNMMAQNKLYRRAFITENQLQFKEGLIHEDELWSFEVACLAKKVIAVKQVTYYYTQRNSGIASGVDISKKNENLKEVVRNMVFFVNNKGIYNEAIHHRINSLFFIILNRYRGDFYKYKNEYNALRGYLKPSFRKWIKTVSCAPKWYLLDIHYVLPKSIAPYWAYYCLTIPYVIFKKKKR